MFNSSENSWVSFGIKPKAKDLKSVLEDLKSMDYLLNIEEQEELSPTIVLDGRKVRIGFEGEKLDPFSDVYASEGELLDEIGKVLNDKQV